MASTSGTTSWGCPTDINCKPGSVLQIGAEHGAQGLRKEDQGRVRDRVATQNIALLRKIAINLVRRQQESRETLRGCRKMADWDDRYMEKIITGIFPAEAGWRTKFVDSFLQG
jgi:hypothetical protein